MHSSPCFSARQQGQINITQKNLCTIQMTQRQQRKASRQVSNNEIIARKRFTYLAAMLYEVIAGTQPLSGIRQGTLTYSMAAAVGIRFRQEIFGDSPLYSERGERYF